MGAAPANHAEVVELRRWTLAARGEPLVEDFSIEFRGEVDLGWIVLLGAGQVLGRESVGTLEIHLVHLTIGTEGAAPRPTAPAPLAVKAGAAGAGIEERSAEECVGEGALVVDRSPEVEVHGIMEGYAIELPCCLVLDSDRRVVAEELPGMVATSAIGR